MYYQLALVRIVSVISAAVVLVVVFVYFSLS